jgi:hypothetical protein
MLKEHDLLHSEETMTFEQRRAFLKLPLEERRRILSRQAEDSAAHYKFEQNDSEHNAWQGGDIVEY